MTLHLLHELLQRMNFPATKAQLIEQAMKLGSPSSALELLSALPEQEYLTADTVIAALGWQE